MAGPVKAAQAKADNAQKIVMGIAPNFNGAVGAVTMLVPSLHAYDKKIKAAGAGTPAQVALIANANKEWAKFKIYMVKYPGLEKGFKAGLANAGGEIAKYAVAAKAAKDAKAIADAAKMGANMGKYLLGYGQGDGAMKKFIGTDWPIFKKFGYLAK
jgi:hypothetical protein